MNSSSLSLKGPKDQPVVEEIDVLTRMLDFDGARVLELGCGNAQKTRQIVRETDVSTITAAEVDQIQHEKNLKIDDLPDVAFKSYGAEAINEPDASFDIVLMFKSLHHVPAEHMNQSFIEIARVLKPGGYAYISEPVFAGDFNDIMRLFHDEEHVREQAFNAIQRCVNAGVLSLVEEYFFRNTIRFESFEQYEAGVLGVTHTNHQLSPAIYEQVKTKFLSFKTPEGFVFQIPNRVDLLRKSA